mmetsp:Transcript_52658/g.145606  ORF Transcript_52658/g.145606 Transcript_52658/m.145606 type:complete len:429 (-) Transcript_52658:348-1634(-)
MEQRLLWRAEAPRDQLLELDRVDGVEERLDRQSRFESSARHLRPKGDGDVRHLRHALCVHARGRPKQERLRREAAAARQHRRFDRRRRCRRRGRSAGRRGRCGRSGGAVGLWGRWAQPNAVGALGRVEPASLAVLREGRSFDQGLEQDEAAARLLAAIRRPEAARLHHIEHTLRHRPLLRPLLLAPAAAALLVRRALEQSAQRVVEIGRWQRELAAAERSELGHVRVTQHHERRPSQLGEGGERHALGVNGRKGDPRSADVGGGAGEEELESEAVGELFTELASDALAVEEQALWVERSQVRGLHRSEQQQHRRVRVGVSWIQVCLGRVGAQLRVVGLHGENRVSPLVVTVLAHLCVVVPQMEEHSSLAKQLEDTHEQRQHAPFVVVATRGAAARAPRRAREEVEDLGAPRAHRLGEAVPLAVKQLFA